MTCILGLKPLSIKFVVVYATTGHYININIYKNQHFSFICILKLEIFGLRFYVF